MNCIKSICLLLTTLTLSACSVYQAASNEGICVSDITKCKSEGCFLSHGMDVVDRQEGSDGKYVVTYRAVARKSGANYVRAAGHGMLDVMTLGLWEVAATPIEGALSNNRGYITVKVTYESKEKDKISAIKIYDENGQLVVDKKVES